jgi:hypothetical protein
LLPEEGLLAEILVGCGVLLFAKLAIRSLMLLVLLVLPLLDVGGGAAGVDFSPIELHAESNKLHVIKSEGKIFLIMYSISNSSFTSQTIIILSVSDYRLNHAAKYYQYNIDNILPILVQP